MSIIQTQTTSFKAQLYQGIHDLTTDVIKIALYTANANLNEDTTVYSATNEVANTGTYSAGGAPAQLAAPLVPKPKRAWIGQARRCPASCLSPL